MNHVIRLVFIESKLALHIFDQGGAITPEQIIQGIKPRGIRSGRRGADDAPLSCGEPPAI
ncbi:MAG: hypothetical protein K9N62_01150 [Verrucomicrobia bacterium]|nr:hypothetical protein [Verrucomicrobiota bacterium]